MRNVPVALLGLLLLACTNVPVATPPGTDAIPDFGPLTVFVGGGDDSEDRMGTAGVLRITALCLYLEHPEGARSELYWPAERTWWNAADRTVGFRQLEGPVVTLAAGDHIELRGSVGPLRPGGGRVIARPPQSPCETTGRFPVVDLTKK